MTVSRVVFLWLAVGMTPASAEVGVSLERLIGRGDRLPNGAEVLAPGYAIFDLDGRTICFHVTTQGQGDAICALDLDTRDVTVIADATTISPTRGVPFSGYLNPTIANGEVSVPGRTTSNHPDGIYAGIGGPVRVITDVLDPNIRIPRGLETNGEMLVLRDTGYAGEALAQVPASGFADPVFFAYRGRPSPGSGELFQIEEVFGVAGDRVTFSALRSNGASGRGVYEWNAANDTLSILVETGDTVPGGRVLNTVLEPVPSGTSTAFIGIDGGFPYFDGVYVHHAAGAIEVIADDDTPYPGRAVTFDGFSALSIDGENVMFAGNYGEGMYSGTFVRYAGELVMLVERGDVLDGRTVMSMSSRWRALHGRHAVVAITMDGFADFGLYLATLTPPCAGDFNGDGALNIFDFLEFQSAFGAEDPTGDFDGNGILNVFDFLAFQTAFNAGC